MKKIKRLHVLIIILIISCVVFVHNYQNRPRTLSPYTISSNCPKGTDKILKESQLKITLNPISCELSDDQYIYKGEQVKVWHVPYGTFNGGDFFPILSMNILQKNNNALVLDPFYTTRTPFDYNEFSNSRTSFNSKNTFVDPLGKYKVSFDVGNLWKDCPSCSPDYNAFINGKKVGLVGGRIMSSPSFSNENKYFSFIEQSNEGNPKTCPDNNCLSSQIRVLNLETGKNLQVQYEHTTEQYPGDTTNYSEVIPIFSSYKWIGEDTVQVSSFFVGVDKSTGNFYRITPTEVWNYDLINLRQKHIETIAD